MSQTPEIGKLLLIAGIAIALIGLVLMFQDKIPFLKDILGKLRLGRLPGDISIEREDFRVYFPWVTCLVISAVLTLLFWLFRK